MKLNPKFQILCLLFLTSQAIFLPSCKKNEPVTEPDYLTVTLPRSVLQNETYYSLDYRERSTELAFSLPVDSPSVAGNISFSDKSGTLDTRYKTISSGKKVILAFQQDFQMKPGWKYTVALKPGLKSTSGVTFRSTEEINVRTSAKLLGVENDTSQRNSILCISDIHMGDPRSTAQGYCWFNKNAAALDSLLALALNSPQVKQVVILGDLFDGWVIPYRIPPFDTSAGIYNIRDYFVSVASAPVNADIINKLRAVASAADQQLIYISGNHDMLLTQEILQEIIPGVIWAGDSPGLGHYSPVDEIVMEHGHRYDFFNCPQPLAIPGHILPPGFFVSRLDAEGLMEQSGHTEKGTQTGTGSVEFLTAWTAAYEYLKFHYSMTVAADSANILMGGIDGYAAPFSFNGIRNLYAENIENVWSATQTGNAVPVTMPVVMAILDGSLDLSFTAAYEYMQSPAPRKYKIVAFGHTHNPMLKVYPTGKNYTGIYANTGSWVNADLTTKPVRTFLVIKPGAWTGSDLDVVSLYQYNLNSGSGDPNPGFVPTLMAEESIIR